MMQCIIVAFGGIAYQIHKRLVVEHLLVYDVKEHYILMLAADDLSVLSYDLI
jgi:hypothetical protein